MNVPFERNKKLPNERREECIKKGWEPLIYYNPNLQELRQFLPGENFRSNKKSNAWLKMVETLSQ